MAESRNLKTRIINKHATAAVWDTKTSFIPLQAEWIIYDKDEEYPFERYKIGDGVTPIPQLPFVTNPHTHEFVEKLKTARTIELSGDVNGSVSFDGSKDVTITTEHIDTTRNDTTSTVTGSHGDTVTIVDGVTTNKTGHVTSVNVKTLTLPTETTLSKGSPVSVGTSSNPTKLSYGDTFTSSIDVLASGHTVTNVQTVYKLPTETELSVDQVTGQELLTSHADEIEVVTGIQKGDTSHNIDVTTTKIKLPELTAGSGISLSNGTIDTISKTYVVEFPTRSQSEMTHGDIWTPEERPELAAQLTTVYNAAVAGDTFNVVMAMGSDHSDMYPCNVSYSTRKQTIKILAHKQSNADLDSNGHLTYLITRSASTSPNITCTMSNYYAEMDTLESSSDRWYDAPTSTSVASYVADKLNTKQDTLVFNTDYDSSTNKAATMSDIQSAANQLTSSLTATVVSGCMEVAFTLAATTLEDTAATPEDDTSTTDPQS